MMKIIDAHAHVFKELTGFGANGELRSIGKGEARWATGEVSQIIPHGYGERSFTSGAFLRMMDANNVEKAVLLQGGFLGFENDYVQEVVEAHPDRFRGAGTFDPFCRNADAILTHLLEFFRIFKFEVSTGCGIMGSHPDFPLDGAMMMHFYERLAKKQAIAVFDLGSPGDGSNQPEAIGNIAKAFPEMTIVVCHLMSPRLGQQVQLEHGMQAMQAKNIFFDLAALFWKVRPEAYPFPTAQGYVAKAKELVGADHLMWGSDAPSTTCKLSYQKQKEYLWESFTPEERQKVFHDTAEQIYFEQPSSHHAG